MTPQPRGQITLPVRLREKYGIKSGVPVRIFDEGTGISISPIEEGNMIKAKYSKKEFKAVIGEIAEFVAINGPLWTKEDDKTRVESLEKDEARLNSINW